MVLKLLPGNLQHRYTYLYCDYSDLPPCLGLGSGCLARGGWEDQARRKKEQAKLEKRLKEIDDSEQYALVAGINGWYPCLHSGRTAYYLNTGEVWKYGVTSKGQFGRYSEAFLFNNKVSCIVEFKGNIAECLKMEQIKLYSYPFLPENLTRPPEERLPRPPYNPIMR